MAFLGHILDTDGLHVDPSKVEAISAMPSPTDVSSVRRFLGMSGYYRKFVPHYGTRTANLTDLLQKDLKFEWLPIHQQEFEDIRAVLSDAPILALPRWDLPFVIRTDASDIGIGGLLCQKIDGVRRIIAAVSRKWGKHKINWDVHRK